ncbi:MAG: ABC transporter ATP-binding protein [Neisseriaceae bacterium]|nr:MAG: ABC transporter ATP-binding protein [Neisseriaceae bacterium]
MAILELKNIVKQFADYTAVNGVSLSIEQGEFFTLLGPSGCGKTTLLRMIAGFESPDSGQILLDGKDIKGLPPEKRPLHTVFQSYALFPHMTVQDNIAFPLKMAKWNKSEIDERVREQISSVQLERFAGRYPHELSGGQRQRVAIARSLVDRPKLLLLDEPLSALDARLREHMHVELVKMQEKSGVTFVYVTHDQSEALALSSRVAVMNHGVVEQLGTPREIYSHPKTYYVADFIGKCNLLKAKVIDASGENVVLKVADSFELTINNSENKFKLGLDGWFAIRPEKIKANWDPRVEEGIANFKAKVKGYYYYGDGTLYEFLLENGTVIQCMLSNNRPHQASFFEDGDEVYISINPLAGNFLVE